MCSNLITDGEIERRHNEVAAIEVENCPECGHSWKPRWGDVCFCVLCDGSIVACPECGHEFRDEGNPCYCDDEA